MKYIDNSGVVEFIVWLKQRNKDRILTTLFSPIFVKLLQKVFVLLEGVLNFV